MKTFKLMPSQQDSIAWGHTGGSGYPIFGHKDLTLKYLSQKYSTSFSENSNYY